MSEVPLFPQYLAHGFVGGSSELPDHLHQRFGVQFENNSFTEMCSGSEVGSYLRLMDFVYHSTLGLRVIKKKKVSGLWSKEFFVC